MLYVLLAGGGPVHPCARSCLRDSGKAFTGSKRAGAASGRCTPVICNVTETG